MREELKKQRERLTRSQLIELLERAKGGAYDVREDCERAIRDLREAPQIDRRAGQLSWGQDDPISQIRVILGAIGCEMSNILAGIASDKAMARIGLMLLEAHTLADGIAIGGDPHAWKETK